MRCGPSGPTHCRRCKVVFFFSLAFGGLEWAGSIVRRYTVQALAGAVIQCRPGATTPPRP